MDVRTDDALAPVAGIDAVSDAVSDEAGELAAFLAAEKVANDYHPGLDD